MIRVAGADYHSPPQYDIQRLPPLTLRICSPGGGGFGDARERDPAAVLRDVEDDIVSIDAARSIYRVAINPETLTLDSEATRELRARRT